MKNRTGKLLAAAIRELAKSLDRLVDRAERGHAPTIVVNNLRRDLSVAELRNLGDDGVGGSPGGVHPRPSNGPGPLTGTLGVSYHIVGEHGPEHITVPAGTVIPLTAFGRTA